MSHEMSFKEFIGRKVILWAMLWLGLYKVELNYEEETMTTTSEFLRIHGVERESYEKIYGTGEGV